MFKEKTVVISGANGYIGSRLLPNLADRGFKVIGLIKDGRVFEGFDNENIQIMTNSEFLSSDMDLKNGFFLSLAFPRKNDSVLLFESFDYTRTMYEKVFQMGCRYILNVSSQSVYDKNRTKEALETDIPVPFNLYGLAKLYVEDLTKKFSEKKGLSYLNLRLGSIVGPNFDIRINNKLLKAYLKDEDISVKEDGFLYSFIHVYDAVDAFIDIISKYDLIEWNTEYNVGSDIEYSLTEIVDYIRCHINHEYKGNLEIVKDFEKGETNKVSIDKLKKQIGWFPKFDLNKIMESILDEKIKNNL